MNLHCATDDGPSEWVAVVGVGIVISHLGASVPLCIVISEVDESKERFVLCVRCTNGSAQGTR